MAGFAHMGMHGRVQQGQWFELICCFSSAAGWGSVCRQSTCVIKYAGSSVDEGGCSHCPQVQETEALRDVCVAAIPYKNNMTESPPRAGFFLTASPACMHEVIA
jgi:Na+-transporting NADH:ubiquinone oxidoreductase subunit NqrF